MTAWTPTPEQYSAIVVLAALVLLGFIIVFTAWVDNRQDRKRDDRIAERYRRGPGTYR